MLLILSKIFGSRHLQSLLSVKFVISERSTAVELLWSVGRALRVRSVDQATEQCSYLGSL